MLVRKQEAAQPISKDGGAPTPPMMRRRMSIGTARRGEEGKQKAAASSGEDSFKSNKSEGSVKSMRSMGGEGGRGRDIRALVSHSVGVVSMLIGKGAVGVHHSFLKILAHAQTATHSLIRREKALKQSFGVRKR